MARREVRVWPGDIDEPRRRSSPGQILGTGAFNALPDDGSSNMDDGGGGGGVPLYIMSVRRYIGPIDYCGFKEFVTPIGFAPRYYAAYSVLGEFWSRFSVSPNCPEAVCDTSAINVGVSKAVFSGSVVVDPSDCSQSGQIECLFSAKGSLPHTSWMQPGYDLANVYLYTGDSLGNIMAQIPGWVVFRENLTNPNVRYSYVPQDETGCFILQGPGRGMGCPGYQVIETVGSEISPGDLGYANYDNLKIQDIISYDEVTGLFDGNLCEVRIRAFFPGALTGATVVMNFAVEPIGGGPITYVSETLRMSGLPGQFNDATYQFPRPIGYTVTYLSGQVIYAPEVFDAFAAAGMDGSLIHDLPATGSWEYLGRFITVQPNGLVSSDFSDYAGIAGSPLTTLITGYDWPDMGRFITAPDGQMSDDFESYSTGTVNNLQYGFGWPAPGYTLSPRPDQAADDFESYTVGAVVELPGISPSPSQSNLWTVEPGQFIDDVILFASDTFESYPDGVILDLDGGTGWNDDGRFF